MKKTKWSNFIYLWVIWALSASFFFYKYLIQVSPSIMTDDLMRAFHIHAAGLGNLSAFYFYAYLIMQIPVGMLLDRYSPRYLTSAAILVCSISTFLFSQTHFLSLACFTRAMMGAGAAFAAVSCFKLASIWFPLNRFALVSGLFMTAAMLGAIGGQVPLALLVKATDWRVALQWVSLAGLILSAVYFLVVRDKKQTESHKIKSTGSFKSFFAILKHPQAWLLSLYSGFAFAPVSVFGGLWGVPFLKQAYAISRTEAAFAISFIFIGFALGAPFLGWLSDYIQKRKPILFWGSFLAIFTLTLVIYFPYQTVLTLSLLLFCFGFSASGFFISFAMIRELFTLLVAATVLGLMNTFDSLCEALFEPLVGLILDATWDGVVENGVHQFSIYHYHLALSLLPLSLLIALGTLFFIKETHCIPVDEKI